MGIGRGTGSGGARRGAGRPPGHHSRSDVVNAVITKTVRPSKPKPVLVPITIEPVVAIEPDKPVQAPVTIERGKFFNGDAVAFFQSVYRNESYPIGIRLMAAKYASSFERPSLLAIAQLQQQPKQAPSISVSFNAPDPSLAPERPIKTINPDGTNVVPMPRPCFIQPPPKKIA